jgi:TonB family protein
MGLLDPSTGGSQLARRCGAMLFVCGLQGVVHLRVLIGPDGEPREIRIDRSSGYKALDEAAREAVSRSQFRPYRENGVARMAVVIVPVEFTLTGRNS